MTELWVKICGITEIVAAHTAAAAGADAIGFVFSPSPRQIDVEKAVQILGQMSERPIVVAVTRQPDPALATKIVQNLKPDYLQADIEDWQGPLADLSLPAGCRALPVFRNQIPAADTGLCLYEGRRSGHGELADWDIARKAVRRASIVLAGGLNPANVANAVATVKPFGVDVSSGVESAPGIKDPLLIERFVTEARRAAREAALGGQND